MKKVIIVAIMMMALCSCTSIDKELGNLFTANKNRISRFHAITEQSDPGTKVYADENMRVLWNAGDMLSIFNHSTYDSKFLFEGQDGDNAGDFVDVTPSGIHSGNSLDYIYAVYPYSSGNKINNAGNKITLTMPAEQQYKEHSFGIGANTMVAVTDNDYLAFKNLGGYLQLRLYGDSVSVSKITIQGNNGEKIAGSASVSVDLGTIPAITMDSSAVDTIALVCNPPVELGTTAEQYTDFWFVIPPVTFSDGFTITVTDALGGVFQKTTTKSLTISRSTIEWMAALEVTPEHNNNDVTVADAIDLGLSVKWASFNIGATKPGEVGGYYAWGETETKSYYNWDNYKWCAGTMNSQTKYCYYSNYGTVDGKLKLDDEDDAAQVLWGNGWRMPTQAELYELANACTWEQETMDGVRGYRVTGPNGNSIFIPQNGQFDESGITWSTSAMLWSSETNGTGYAYLLGVPGNKNINATNHRHDGLCIRPVIDDYSGYSDHKPAIVLIPDDVESITIVLPPANEIWYESHSGNTIPLAEDSPYLISNTYSNGKGVYKFSKVLTSIEGMFDYSYQCGTTKENEDFKSLILPATITRIKQFGISHLSHATTLVLPEQLAMMESDCLCRFGESTTEVSKIYFIGEIAPSFVSTSIWNMHDQVSGGQKVDKFYFPNNNSTYASLHRIIVQGTATHYWVPANYTITCPEIVFEDANFKAYCVENFDTNHDGEISFAEAKEVTGIYANGRNITSLQGIEFFTNLEALHCWDNNLSDIDVSKNPMLKQLGIAQNNLTKLNVSSNLLLEELSFNDNAIDTIDISRLSNLRLLNCYNNQLTSLDVSNNAALTVLNCSNNKLTSLNVSKNIALTKLLCYSNQLTSLDVINNTLLKSLYCWENALSDIDVSKNLLLEELAIAQNNLTELNLSSNLLLKELSFNHNAITSVDVSELSDLELLNCYNNQLTSLDVSNNAALTGLYCYNNPNLVEIWLKIGQTIDTLQYDTDVATIKYKGGSAVNLSADETANSYIAHQNGYYKFNAAVKGNSTNSVGSFTAATVLWETFNTNLIPKVGDIVSDVSLMDGFVFFRTGELDGNALIAVTDADGKILWSWHIWVTDYDPEKDYDVYNDFVDLKVMDRNLGAMSKNPGDGSVGLIYEWGRKDPFPGCIMSTKKSFAMTAESQMVTSSTTVGTEQYAIEHPTTYIIAKSQGGDWLQVSNDEAWSSTKTMYDPCPAGWRVPDGGENGLWKSLGTSGQVVFDNQNYGISIGQGFSSNDVWMPAQGYMSDSNTYSTGWWRVGIEGRYWTVHTNEHWSDYVSFTIANEVFPYQTRWSIDCSRANGNPVRCCKE